MGSEGSRQIFSDLADRTGVSPDDVQKVLSQLGLEKVLSEMGSQGITKTISSDDLKIAVRLGPNTVTV